MTPQAFLIPLQNIPQAFNITLANNNYIMTCKWNDSPDGGWLIGFADQETGDQIVNNIPLITGADLLDGLDYLGFEGQLFIYTNGDETAVPTLDNLGTEANLYFVTSVAS